jgi:predicted nuclease with RNAse H fold
MLRNVTNEVVAGIDVGGTKKGFHLVLLRGNEVLLSTNSPHPDELVQHCIRYQAVVVSVDAPCQWAERVPRQAEREMAREGIFSFSTPSRAKALSSAFYGWMFNGERMYAALAEAFPLLDAPDKRTTPSTFETFPHAICCALIGRDVASAKMKRRQRRALLTALGLDTMPLKSIDALDAAMCAVTAQSFLSRTFKTYGDVEGGFLIVPAVVNRIILP